MITLDGVERTLAADDLLICDADGRAASAIAGIMGGGDLRGLRQHHRDPARVRLLPADVDLEVASGSGCASEASARFERGVDPNGCDAGADRAVQLLVEIAGGVATPGSVDIYPRPVERPRITLRTARVNALLGTRLTAAEVIDAIRPARHRHRGRRRK